MASLLLALVVGCSSAVRWDDPGVHVVRPGDTLYSIAWRHGLDHRDLARWNQLGDGSLIFPGQRIRLSGSGRAPQPGARTAERPPDTSGDTATRPAREPARPVAALADGWQWPTEGAVVARFGESAQTQSGIQIGGLAGQPVLASADGEIVYSGTGLIGYGALLIIKHNANWLSAYGHNRELLVQEGDRVSAGQRIATMGEGPGRRPLLHFEIRRDGDPVDPMRHLPQR